MAEQGQRQPPEKERERERQKGEDGEKERGHAHVRVAVVGSGFGGLGAVWSTGGCTSWYLDASGRNTTIWPGTTTEFRIATRRVDLGEYDVLRAPNASAVPRPGTEKSRTTTKLEAGA